MTIFDYYKNKGQSWSKDGAMSSLADKIEQYIKVLLDRSSDGSIEIQRLELAETFQCVPSQITYVISTRFTPDNGFVVESKRGGRGYVRVRRIESAGDGSSSFKYDVLNYVNSLKEEGTLTNREALLLISVIEAVTEEKTAAEQEELLSRLLKAVRKSL